MNSSMILKNIIRLKKKITLNEIIKGLNYPWGMTFIDKENLIITEKNGGLLKINVITKKSQKIKHKIKSIPFNGSEQGGFLDVLYNDGYLYFLTVMFLTQETIKHFLVLQ